MKILIATFLCLSSFLFTHQSIAAEGDTYSFTWLDPDKEVFVLQNRKFRKDSRLYMNLGGGFTTSGAFVDSMNVQFRAGYFFKEEWGFEVLYSKNNGEENDTAKSVRNIGGAGSIPFRRIIDNYTGAMVLWSPFYNKINTFNKIIYVDWILGLGFAKLDETNNKEEYTIGLPTGEGTKESHTGIMWNLGAMLYFTENINFRTDLNAIHYKAELPGVGGDQMYNHYDLTFSIGYRF